MQVARRWTFYIGPDGKILDIDKNPGTQNAAENLLAKLQSLGIKQK
jgi:peroxiredoxin